MMMMMMMMMMMDDDDDGGDDDDAGDDVCTVSMRRISALTSSRILQPKSLDMTKQTLNG